MPRHYQLTSQLVAAHAGGPVVCLDPGAVGRTFRAFSRRPGPERNRSGRAMLSAIRADHDPMRVVRAEPEPPEADVLVVAIEGPIEQRAGQHEPSGSWVDGHDAIYERLAAAFEMGDVVIIGDSPGGVVVGGPEHVRRALEMKRKHGRRCIGFTEAGAFSMCLWWMVAVCDEIFVSRDGRLGSIGARGMLGSIVGALEKEGVALEIVEDPEGKAAGAPERPIDDEARQRAQRDVTAAADMFRAAVCESPVGKRHGLTPDGLRAMRGDIYQGARAVSVGLADDVATLEDVLGYALATAGEGATMDPDDEKDKDEGAEDENGPASARAEDDKPCCKRCGEEPGDGARFCAKCGTKVAEDEQKDDAEDEPPPSSKPAPGGEDDEKKDDAKAIASLSLPALRATAIGMHRALAAIGAVVGEKSHARIEGAVRALATDAKNAVRYRSERNTARADLAYAKKHGLAMRLIDCNVEGWQRGDIFADTKGRKFTDAFAALKVDTIEGMVQRFEASRKKDATPFEPDRKKAETAEKKSAPTPKGEPSDADIEAALSLPAVQSLVKGNPGRDPKMIAKTYLTTVAGHAARRTA